MINYDYDEQSDVMYINFSKPKKCKCIEPEEVDGIVLRYTLNGELNGITIINFKERIG